MHTIKVPFRFIIFTIIIASVFVAAGGEDERFSKESHCNSLLSDLVTWDSPWPAVLAGDLVAKDGAELQRIKKIADAMPPNTMGLTLLFVVGIKANHVQKNAENGNLERYLRTLGVAFIERPPEIDTKEKLIAYMNEEFKPDPKVIERALAPMKPITVSPLPDGVSREERSAFYLRPKIEGFNGDAYFLATNPELLENLRRNPDILKNLGKKKDNLK